MTTTVTYPSEVVPGPPPIRLEMPDGWTHVWAPETLIAIRDDAQGVDHFLANVVVRYYQRMAPFGGEEIHAELQEYVDARRDASSARSGRRPSGTASGSVPSSPSSTTRRGPSGRRTGSPPSRPTTCSTSSR